jgi:hypothetical protein
MPLAPLTESDLIDQIYSDYENDNTTWASTSAEYLTVRRYCKGAILRWEYLEGTRWKELYTKLSAAADGTKTITAGTYTYGCPTDMRTPPQQGNYVRLINAGNSSYYEVLPLSKVEQMDDASGKFCYFTGNPELGFTLNINPEKTLATGDTIAYEYYRNATYFTATTSVTEMSNPFFIVHYALSRLYKNDGLLNESREELQVAETLLTEMKSDNFDVITDGVSEDGTGFGV